MNLPIEDDFITNSDESRKLPDENPEPLEGTKKEESTLLEADRSTEVDKSKSETKNLSKK